MIIRKNILLILGLTIILLLQLNNQVQARENFRGAFNNVTRSMSIEEIKASKESCIQCHSRVTPMLVDEHKSSAHSKAGLGCIDCHGSDHSNMPIVTGKKVCAKCHAKETQEMIASKHYDSWSKMWSNARYLDQSKAIRQQACGRCHDISSGFENVKDVRCDYCHSTHEFSVTEAKNPAVCTTCHMGPDHPQAEAYETSAHSKQANLTCVTCHQAQGTHNVSLNMGLGGVSNGSLLDSWNWVMNSAGKPLLKRPVINQSDFDKARNGNLDICNKCHLAEFSQQWLNGADQVKMAVEQELLQAQQIVQQLDKEGLLYPNPATRKANPVEGQKLVLGGNQLYDGTSKAEAIYFKMYKFAAATAFKSAYHQDFKRAGTDGILQMKVLMEELQEEANTLRNLGPVATYEKEKEKEIKTDKKPNYLKFGLIGFGVGVGIAISISILLSKKKKGKWPVGFFILLLAIGFTIGFPKEAKAWSNNPNDQKQCSACHQKEQKQLKTGKHATLKCLDCHEQGKNLTQVKKPETCGKCHSGASGYALETYQSSPHGVQYQIKGENKWVPTCATCHMPQGSHNPVSVMGDVSNQFKGIGEECLKCHTTDKVIKFNQDKKDIDKQAENLVKDLKQVGVDLIAKGIIVPAKGNSKNKDLKEQWGTETKWEMVNSDKLAPEEGEMAQRLVDELDSKTKEGLNENAPKMKIGAAHLNPDYMHWYGNAYLNLNLTDAKSTAKEIEMLAQKAGYTAEKSRYKKQLTMAISIAMGSAVVGFGLAAIVLGKSKRS